METITPRSKRRIRKIIAASVLIPAILLSGLHFFVNYKAKQLLPTLVSRMSDGKYTMTSKSFNFSYFSPYLKLSGVHLYPKLSDMDEEYHVRIDSFYLSIESIIPIFFNKSINVQDIRLVNPSVTIKRNKIVEGQISNDEIHVRMHSMQNNAIRFLNELSVNSCDIVSGSFRFYPFPDSKRNFNIEHINLSIRDLVIPPYEGNQTASIDGKIKLSIKDPRISIPDSLLDVSMDNFIWDNQELYLNVGNFMISQKSAQPRADSFLIALDTIRVKHVYWNTWLDSGILRLDTLIANNGNMYFESSVTKAKRKPADSAIEIRKLKVWDAIGDLDIDYFSARFINAAIINKNIGKERSNSVIGDSLIVQDLSIRPDRKNPLMIRDLGLGVREFVDRGTNNKFQSSFSRMKLKGDTMVLNNYYVQSTPQSRMGKGSSLFIPTLTIEGLSIEDLMDVKATVREVRMDQPQLTLFANIEGGNSNGLKLSRKTLEEIKPYVDVERVILNDAKVTINSKKNKGYSLGTQEFSAVILSRSAIKATDMDGFVSSFKNVNLKRFFYVTPTSQFELFNGSLDYSNKALHFDRVSGYTGNKRVYTNLVGVDLIGDPRMQPFENDVVWHFKKISVDSGDLRIALDSATAVDDRNPEQLIGIIDSLILNNISIHVQKNKMEAGAFVYRSKVVGQRIYPGKYLWDQAGLTLKDIVVKTENADIKSSNADIVSKGNSTFSNTKIAIRNGKMDLDVTAPSIFMNSNFSSIDANNISINEIKLSEPIIDLHLRKDSIATSLKTASKSSTFELKKFKLEHPQFNVVFHRDNRLTRLSAKGDNFEGSKMNYNSSESSSLFSMESFKVLLDNLKMDDGDNEAFRTGKITLETGQVQKLADHPAIFDLKGFQVGAVDFNHSWKRDTMEARTDGITLGNIPGLVLQKDSLIQAAFKIPPANVLPSSFVFRTSENKFSIQNFRVNTASQFLEWDSLEIQNRLSRDSFFAKQPFEKDYITFSTGKIRAEALKPILYRKDTAVYIRKLTIDPMNFKVERDKRMPDDTVSYRPLMTRMLNKLPFLVKVDTIQFNRSLIWHNVIDEKTEKEGTIFFTNVNGYLSNVKNFDFQEGDSLRLNVRSGLMGQGDLRVQFREAYNDTLQGFLLSARMGAFDMKELNRLMTPLFNVRIDRGKVRDLAMRVKGTDPLAYGSMDMNYDNLRISVLTQDNKRRDFVSWLANLFVRGKNNKTGIVYAERLKERSIFNYWARISVNGLLTNLGVRQNGKQVRRFYKGLEKNQLPPDLF